MVAPYRKRRFSVDISFLHIIEAPQELGRGEGNREILERDGTLHVHTGEQSVGGRKQGIFAIGVSL